MENKTTTKTRYMVNLALMSAIVVLMALTPLGYIRTPALSITLIPIPVAVGAIILGPKGGAILGAVFGITSFSQALTGAGMVTILIEINPLAALFMCLVPRILEGFLCGLIFQLLQKAKLGKPSYYIAGISCPVFNTVLFMGSLVAFFYRTEYIQTIAASLDVSNPLIFIAAFVGAQALFEAAFCGILSGTICIALSKALRR